MGSSGWDIVGLIMLIIGLLILFPEYYYKILENKLYMVGLGIAAFCVLFLIWLKVKTRY